MGHSPLATTVPALEARNVTKTYDRVRYVLENVDVAVDPGEVVVLMGRSGSGKTTLLNILAGLETPTSGTVLVGETDVASLDEDERTRVRREEVGVVFQRFHLIPELTVRENVELPMRLAGRSDRGERATELLAFFGLQDHADAYPATLSGGETQRAALARALGNEPAVVLADEPTANLDEDNALNALDALRAIAEEMDTAVLIATHDPLAEQAGDRVLDLVDGRIAREAQPELIDQGVQADGRDGRPAGGASGAQDAGVPGPAPSDAPSGGSSGRSVARGRSLRGSTHKRTTEPEPGETDSTDSEAIPEIEAEADPWQGPDADEEDEDAV